MNEKIEKIKQNIETFLMNSIEHQNKEIDYILLDKEKEEVYILASDKDEAIEFTPYSKDYKNGYVNVPEWDYNFDYYIYNYLEEGKQIVYMKDEVHYSIWNSINELYPNDIEYKDGVQNYLQYCVDNGITKKYLDEKTGFDTPNVMKYFEGVPLYKTMEYKGYIIEVDDRNVDNPKESLINIYDNKKSFEDNKCIETVSLNTIGLKQNIRDYIDEFYIDKSNIESEKAYITFILGYDLLNNMLLKSPSPENDISYDFCNMIAEKFLKSEQYKNEKYSTCEMLEEWVITNRNSIRKDYEKFIGFDIVFKTPRKLENAIVLDVGYRGNKPIALVERKIDDEKEYVVSFNYKIKDNKIDWGYGYYYDNDFAKAKEDFEEVISGGNIADTFVKKNKEREER